MTETPLESQGLPLYYTVENADKAGFISPQDRHGQSVRTWVRSLTEMQKEALVTSAMTGVSWRFASDEGAYLMGADVAPNPLTFLSVGMVSSYANEITALAAQRSIALSGLNIVLENFYYRDGSFPKGTMIGGALPPELTVECQTDSDDQAMMQLLFEAVSASPLNGLMLGSLTSLFTFTHNGKVLAPEHVTALDSPPYPDPGDQFPNLIQAQDENIAQPIIQKLIEEKVVVERLKTTPPPASPKLGKGQSLIHLQVTCTIRPDGVKEIIKEQFAPTTSTWRFMSDEAAGFGGKGRAPDAASYISAGIAFCFMTQLGRYAKMAKIPLNAYRVIQDTHFSKGGASGGTGKAGRADPVETHVYFDTDTDDQTAQKILGVGERTCFLHAFCRTDLKAKTRYVREKMAASG